MCVISPRELLLESLYKYDKIKDHSLIVNLGNICGILGGSGIYVPIDFNAFGKYTESDVLGTELWALQSGGAIKELKGSIIYQITEKGKKLTESYRNRRTIEEKNIWKKVSEAINLVH